MLYILQLGLKVQIKFKTYRSVFWCYVLQYSQAIKQENKAFRNIFPHTHKHTHTCLWYIQFEVKTNCWLTLTSQVDLPNMVNFVRTLTRSVWTLHLTYATYVNKTFLPLSDLNRGFITLFELFSKFPFNSNRWSRWIKLQPAQLRSLSTLGLCCNRVARADIIHMCVRVSACANKIFVVLSFRREFL